DGRGAGGRRARRGAGGNNRPYARSEERIVTTAAADVPELASRRAPAAARAGVRARWGLAGLLAAALLVRVPGMTESIWFDEYYRTFVKMRPENLYALLF